MTFSVQDIPSTDPAPSARPPATISVSGAQLTLDHRGAVWWPDQRTLVVSDLHFEKGSAYAERGLMLPPYDTRATLAMLEALIAQWRPSSVIALGDSFHDQRAAARMAREDCAALRGLIAGVQNWVWIEGNHDPSPPLQWGGRREEVLSLGPLTFRHEPAPAPTQGEVAGHYHPCARVRGRGRSVRRRCFLTDGARLILPALGAYTGGLNVRDPAYTGLFSGEPIAFVLAADQVLPLNSRRLCAD